MQAAAELSAILQGVILFNKARINFIADFILGLIKVRTVNWVEVAQAFSGSSKLSSKYRRIQRFFQECTICKTVTAEIISAFFPPPKNGWVLSLDRTNWNFGIFKINILMLSITYHNLAIPLIWIMLPKKGNSNTEERIKLMQMFLKIFSCRHIASLLGDREFIGDDWITWLHASKIKFTIRIKNNQKVLNKKGKLVKCRKLFYMSSIRGRVIKNPVFIGKSQVFIAGKKLDTGEWLIVITSHDAKNALSRYKLRWGIETLFAALKTRGFNLEQTHITCIDKIDTLIALLAIAYIWAYKIGEITVKKEPIKVKSHGKRQQSVFRVGLDLLRMTLLNWQSYLNEIQFHLLVFKDNISEMLIFDPVGEN